jgi:stage III sporulation protein SpoIIIAA
MQGARRVAQRRRAHRIIAVAANAHRCQTGIVSAFVTVHTRQRAMNAPQRAAHRRMRKACLRKRLLVVAVPTAWSQRIVVDVIPLMAACALVRHAAQGALLIGVTHATRHPVVRPRQRFRRDLMLWPRPRQRHI